MINLTILIKMFPKQGVAKHDQLLPDVTGCGRSPCLHDCHAFRSHRFLQRLASTKFHFGMGLIFLNLLFANIHILT